VNTPINTVAPERFVDLGVHPKLVGALERRGISSPYPIQSATLPDAILGRDVCGRAPTGSGKTLAFGLATLTRLASDGATKRRGHRPPRVLVLVPTRELAAQIADELTPLAASIGAWVLPVYGGVGYGKQINSLRKGIDLLIACPGRLADLEKRGDVDLSCVEMVVVDEADRMADMGFLPAVRQLIDLTSSNRQVMLFSATLGGPVAQLISDYQDDPALHDVDSSEADRGEVRHHFWRIADNERVSVTAQTVTENGPAIVFCRTKHGADRLSERLGRLGLRTAAIHGDRNQNQRERALSAFRDGRVDVLVATDVAARGIHVDAVPLVVHFDPPADDTDYVHRAGRTGRAGADGMVVSIVTSSHVAITKKLQQKLGLTAEFTSPGTPGVLPTPSEHRNSSTSKPSTTDGRRQKSPGRRSRQGNKATRAHGHRRRQNSRGRRNAA
jgi:superfamily II DNA/RNA helicase